MKLTVEEKRIVEGKYGPGMQKCMGLLVKWGEIFGAERMVPVNHVHLGPSMPNKLLEEMSEGVDKVRTISSLHAAFDSTWFIGKFGIMIKGDLSRGVVIDDESEFIKRIRLLAKLGFLPSFTCAPYIIGMLPRAGDVLCWTGSAGQTVCNSFFSALAGRESTATCFAAAITGKTPYMGQLKKENRYAKILIELRADLKINELTEADYGALGYYIGEKVSFNNIAIRNVPQNITFEKERMLVSPLAVSGACTMCHIIGVTPEALTIDKAFGNRKPEEVLILGKRELRASYSKLTNADTDRVDMVVVGCPHLTIVEIAQLSSLLERKKVNQNLRLLVGVSNPIYDFACDSGYVRRIEESGGTFMNICVAAANRLIFPKELPKVVATNSARAAHYIQRMTAGKSKTIYGNMEQCIEAALTGKMEIL